MPSGRRGESQPLLGSTDSVDDHGATGSAAADADDASVEARINEFFATHAPDSKHKAPAMIERAKTEGLEAVLSELHDRYGVLGGPESGLINDTTAGQPHSPAEAAGDDDDRDVAASDRVGAGAPSEAPPSEAFAPPTIGYEDPQDTAQWRDFFAADTEAAGSPGRAAPAVTAEAFARADDETTSAIDESVADTVDHVYMDVVSDAEGPQQLRYALPDNSDEERNPHRRVPGTAGPVGTIGDKPVHYQVEPGDEGLERSILVARERFNRAHRDLVEVNAKTITVRRGYYNRRLADDLVAKKEKELTVDKWPMTRIEDIINRAALIHEAYVDRGLMKESDAAGERAIRERLIRMYVSVGLRGMALFEKRHMSSVLEFDEEQYERRLDALGDNHIDVLWQNMLQRRILQEQVVLKDLQHFMANDAWHAECEFIPMRVEDFIVELNKMSTETLEEQRHKGRHWVFSPFADANVAAWLAFKHNEQLREQELQGAARLHASLAPTLERKTRAKYTTMASYLRNGGVISEFSVDIYFDGAKFAAESPFSPAPGQKAAPGFIRTINFALPRARQTPLYKEYRHTGGGFFGGGYAGAGGGPGATPHAGFTGHHHQQQQYGHAPPPQYQQQPYQQQNGRFEPPRELPPKPAQRSPLIFPQDRWVTRDEQKAILADASGIANLGAFFAALLEGERAVTELREIILDGNRLTGNDVATLGRLLQSATRLEMLSIAGCVFDSDAAVKDLGNALLGCRAMRRVNFSSVAVEYPYVPPAQPEGVRSPPPPPPTTTVPPQIATARPPCITQGGPVVVRPAPDGVLLELLKGLRGSTITLNELWCAGALPPVFVKLLGIPEAIKALVNSDVMHTVRRGNASRECAGILKSIIESFPNLVSINVSFQSLPSNDVADMMNIVRTRPHIMNALFVGIRTRVGDADLRYEHERQHVAAQEKKQSSSWLSCCCPKRPPPILPQYDLFDEPSPGVVCELIEIAAANRERRCEVTRVGVVREMVSRYLAAVQHGKTRKLDKLRQRHRTYMERRRRVEALVLRKSMELGEVSALEGARELIDLSIDDKETPSIKQSDVRSSVEPDVVLKYTLMAAVLNLHRFSEYAAKPVAPEWYDERPLETDPHIQWHMSQRAGGGGGHVAPTAGQRMGG
uniref:Uncharacterized protein n=1 Tax=Neobodo designis TaxID=312471 RepID=A0A7S1PWZ6_NEODS